MTTNKSTAAWPVISLFAALALIIASYARGFPDWTLFVILGGWWVGFTLWGKYFRS